MRAVGGAEADYSSEEDEEDTSEGIANSDDENEWSASFTKLSSFCYVMGTCIAGVLQNN